MKKYSPRSLDMILKNCDIKLGVLFTHLTINIIGQNQPYNGKTTHLFSCALSCISSSYLVSRKMAGVAGEQLQNVRFEEPFLMVVDQSLLAADEDWKCTCSSFFFFFSWSIIDFPLHSLVKLEGMKSLKRDQYILVILGLQKLQWLTFHK